MPRGKKNVAVDEVKNTEVIEKAAKLTPDSVLNSLNNVQTNVQKLLGNLSASFLEKFEERDVLVADIALKNSELARLRAIEVTATTLDDLEAKHQQMVLDDANERNQLEDDRQKEETEFQYKLSQERRAELDKYTQENAARVKAWNERESALTSREQELKELNAKVAAFDDDKAKAVKAAEAILSNVLKKNYETDARITLAETNSKISLLESEKNALLARNVELVNTVNSLKEDLVNARKDLVAVSNKALESASGREVAVALQTANAQANQNSKSKN